MLKRVEVIADYVKTTEGRKHLADSMRFAFVLRFVRPGVVVVVEVKRREG